jgi:DNA-binding NarL/FixJ family response regulator
MVGITATQYNGCGGSNAADESGEKGGLHDVSRGPAFVIGSIRVLLADDSRAGRRRIRRTLARMGDVLLVGESTTARGTIRAARRTWPGVIVIRSARARPGLLQAVRRLRSLRPEVQIVAVTREEPKVFLRTARAFGVSFSVPQDFVEIRLPSLVRLAHRDHCESLEKLGPTGSPAADARRTRRRWPDRCPPRHRPR